MRRLIALLGLSLGIAAPLYAAPVEIAGGVEQFVWQEYDYGGSKLVKESGPRLFVSLEAERPVSDRWVYGFRGRLYSGSVSYDGQLINGAPYVTDTEYDGISIMADFFGRFVGSDGDYSNLGLSLGVGGEGWRRHILGFAGYTEEYAVLSGKLGVAYLPGKGLFGEVGGKYPFSTHEDVDLYDDVSLKPQGAFSLYATVGYNFNQRWVLKGYYNSYRFKASDPAPLYNLGTYVGDVIQPESSMDVFGVTAGFYF